MEAFALVISSVLCLMAGYLLGRPAKVDSNPVEVGMDPEPIAWYLLSRAEARYMRLCEAHFRASMGDNVERLISLTNEIKELQKAMRNSDEGEGSLYLEKILKG